MQVTSEAACYSAGSSTELRDSETASAPGQFHFSETLQQNQTGSQACAADICVSEATGDIQVGTPLYILEFFRQT